jgi:prepilin-type N-terminal cleavage/methylation domain-containing protein
MSLRRQRLRSRGFTLLELVVVVAVLVILAGLVLPKLDLFEFQAGEGISSANIADINRFIQQYRVQNFVYPDKWDSLMDMGNGGATGTVWKAPDMNSPGLPSGSVGGPVAGYTPILVPTTLNEGELQSLGRVGITTVLDLGVGTYNGYTIQPANRFTVPRALNGTTPVVTVDQTNGAWLLQHLYPQGYDTSTRKVVVFGLGPKNTAIGQTIQWPPYYANLDQNQWYNRYLCYFDVSENGERAQLIGVSMPDCDNMTDAMGDFYRKGGW